MHFIDCHLLGTVLGGFFCWFFVMNEMDLDTIVECVVEILSV